MGYSRALVRGLSAVGAILNYVAVLLVDGLALDVGLRRSDWVVAAVMGWVAAARWALRRAGLTEPVELPDASGYRPRRAAENTVNGRRCIRSSRGRRGLGRPGLSGGSGVARRVWSGT